jgi:protein TonB
MPLFNNTSFLDLKKNHVIYFESSLVITLISFIGLFNTPLTFNADDEYTKYVPTKDVLHFEMVKATMHPPIKPRPPEPIFVPPKRPVDYIFEEQLNWDAQILIHEEPLLYPKKEDPNEPIVISEGVERVISSQKMGYIIGGYIALQKRITYPPQAVSDNIQGRVVIQYLIDEKGRVRNPKIIKGLRYDVNKEALRALRKSRFYPVLIDGEPVPVDQVIHIVFKIKYPK